MNANNVSPTHNNAYGNYLKQLAGGKHQESILAVRMTGSLAASLGLRPGITRLSWEDMLIACHSETVVRQRALLEKDEQYVQYLPYVTFVQVRGGRLYVFMYQRGKGVGESRLAGNDSCGLGGHVEGHEAKYTAQGILDLHRTLATSTLRELEEEVGFAEARDSHIVPQDSSDTSGRDAYFNGVIMDQDEVGRVHMGLSLIVVLSPDLTDKDLSWLRCREAELCSYGMIDAEAALHEMSGESWTKLVLTDLLHQFYLSGSKINFGIKRGAGDEGGGQ